MNNLFDILLYSPRAIDNNNEKILFIFYQLLKLYEYLHSLNLNCSELKLSDIYIDTNYFVKAKLPLECMLKSYESKPESKCCKTDEDEIIEDQKDDLVIEWPLKVNVRDVYNSYR